MRRLFPIPAAGVLGAGLSGCADPIVGDWACSELNGIDMPYTFTDDNSGGVYTFTYSVQIEIWRDLGAQIRFRSQLEYSGGGGGASYGYVLRADVVTRGDRSYLIDFDYDELDCSLTDGSGALECEAVEGDALTFARED